MMLSLIFGMGTKSVYRELLYLFGTSLYKFAASQNTLCLKVVITIMTFFNTAFQLYFLGDFALSSKSFSNYCRNGGWTKTSIPVNYQSLVRGGQQGQAAKSICKPVFSNTVFSNKPWPWVSKCSSIIANYVVITSKNITNRAWLYFPRNRCFRKKKPSEAWKFKNTFLLSALKLPFKAISCYESEIKYLEP